MEGGSYLKVGFMVVPIMSVVVFCLGLYWGHLSSGNYAVIKIRVRMYMIRVHVVMCVHIYVYVRMYLSKIHLPYMNTSDISGAQGPVPKSAVVVPARPRTTRCVIGINTQHWNKIVFHGAHVEHWHLPFFQILYLSRAYDVSALEY